MYNPDYKFILNFLIDTGASFTTISWNDDQDNKMNIKNLKMDNIPFNGIGGGQVNRYVLSNSCLIFASDQGGYYHSIPNLYVGSSHTTNGIKCPEFPSLLSIDIINQFELSLKVNHAYLIKS